MDKVFVIIVTFNGRFWYDRCFGSLRSSEIPVQTIVVDNASSDDTVPYIKANYPEIILIQSDKNIGFGQANNKGIRYVLEQKSDYIFLLNQDAWIEPDTIKKLVQIHSRHKDYGILSPMHLNAEKTKIEDGLLNYFMYNNLTYKQLINDMYFGKLSELYSIKNVNAAAWLLPTYILRNIGGFDPIFFHYGEDDNYMHRVLYHGYKIGICPLTHIVHDKEHLINSGNLRESLENRQLLLRFTNINNEENLYYFILSGFCDSIFLLFTGKREKAKKRISNVIYLWENRKKMVLSKRSNKILRANWL
jgi:N-acetylglucosaminyl-diphospho-decaprenol L-rhamnosyltransferase